jgi:hypothetical protein
MVVMSDEEAASSSCYQQLDDPPGQLHATKSTDVHDTTHPHPPAVVRPPPWSFADSNKLVGDGEDDQPRLFSRDGSPHVTDEVFNSASHLFAAMLSLLGTVLLITQSGGDAWKIVSFSIYGSSLMFLFACSTLHHGICSTEEVSPFFTRPAPPPPHLHFVFRRVGGVVVVVVEVFVTISRVLFLCVPIS